MPYIIKENRTYDQVLGDLKTGNGDPTLALFGRDVTPNLHKMAEDFTLFDNFFVNGDVSADGHEWSTAAIATDYTQKTFPNQYAGRWPLPGPGIKPNVPPAGRIWDAMARAGISLRNYGYFVLNTGRRFRSVDDVEPTPSVLTGQQATASAHPELTPATDREFRGFDLSYPDVARAEAFRKDLLRMEAEGKMPQFSIMHLGNDHIQATRAGAYTPTALVADNDRAAGLIVDAISHSKFWGETCIFIVEDDAQDGADHVDSHRAPVWVVSPYTRRRFVDHTFYNTTSVLRTMEAILGAEPLTQFDLGSDSMWTAFQVAIELKKPN